MSIPNRQRQPWFTFPVALGIVGVIVLGVSLFLPMRQAPTGQGVSHWQESLPYAVLILPLIAVAAVSIVLQWWRIVLGLLAAIVALLATRAWKLSQFMDEADRRLSEGLENPWRDWMDVLAAQPGTWHWLGWTVMGMGAVLVFVSAVLGWRRKRAAIATTPTARVP